MLRGHCSGSVAHYCWRVHMYSTTVVHVYPPKATAAYVHHLVRASSAYEHASEGHEIITCMTNQFRDDRPIVKEQSDQLASAAMFLACSVLCIGAGTAATTLWDFRSLMSVSTSK